MQTYVYRLYDNRRTVTLDWMMAEAAFVWNHALALQRRYFSLAKSCGWQRTYIGAARMMKHFARRISRKRLDAQTVQEILQRQDTAFVKFFKHQNRRPPKFRKAGEFSSFVFKQNGYKLFGNELVINKVSKRFRFALSRPWDGKVKNVRVIRSRKRWLVAIVTGLPEDYNTAGISVGDHLVKAHDGAIKGELRGWAVQPYIGLGYGRPVSNDYMMSFAVELGFRYVGNPTLWTVGDTMTGSEWIAIPKDTIPDEYMSKYDNFATLLSFYPMLSVRVYFNIL